MTSDPSHGAFSIGDYFDGFGLIQGYFSPDAALAFFAYANLARTETGEGDALEIGVHHGLSAIAVAAVRAPARRFLAIDLFESGQTLNRSHSGAGARDVFVENMRRFHPDLTFLDVFEGASSSLDAARLGRNFSFCHVDGGHSAEETYGDLDLCAKVLLPGGLLALDDYFNPWFPGVAEGAIGYSKDHPGVYRPIAVGFNKVILRRTPFERDLDERFSRAFPLIPHVEVTFWGHPTRLFSSALSPYFDLAASTPERLEPRSAADVSARLDLPPGPLRAQPGEAMRVPVQVVNTSSSGVVFCSPEFGVSYHLLAEDGSLLEFEHPRSRFPAPLPTGESTTVPLDVRAPGGAGTYFLDFDVVWEGVKWFRAAGEGRVRLEVAGRHPDSDRR